MLPNFEAVPVLSEATRPPTELETIEIFRDLSDGKKLVRVGAAATNERLRRWCIKNKSVTLPLNIIMVEITCGGSNGPICHGAGRRHKTLSDLVRRIEYIDAHGQARVIEDTDKEFLTAASGCFGLLGVITHLTLEFDPMSYAVLRPAKVDTLLTIPPPRERWDDLKSYVPAALLKKFSKTPAAELRLMLEKAQKDFEARGTDDYYAEWFWFPYSDMCWINTWNTTTDASGVQDWPGPWLILTQFAQTFLANVAQKSDLLKDLEKLTGLDQAATTLQSRFAMFVLPDLKPDENPTKAYLIDALHFFRCIQNVPVRDVEVEIPLLPSAQDKSKPDFAVVQRAWWDAILQCYKYARTSPQRMPLEMRIMGGSDVVMAPQRGNTLGTCSIEVLTLESQKDIWTPYAQEICDTWLSYVDPSTGKKLKTRPHWAKEWYNIKLNNGEKKWLTKLRDEDYRDEIAEFKRILAKIGKRDGWTLSDLKKRFSNNMFDELIFFDVDVAPQSKVNGFQSSIMSKAGDFVTTSPVDATEV